VLRRRRRTEEMRISHKRLAAAAASTAAAVVVTFLYLLPYALTLTPEERHIRECRRCLMSMRARVNIYTHALDSFFLRAAHGSRTVHLCSLSLSPSLSSVHFYAPFSPPPLVVRVSFLKCSAYVVVVVDFCCCFSHHCFTRLYVNGY